ncbi:MAG TPA: hypothetical protein VEW95_06605 [Candidatus Limnocylindrales bacterium]|nr:hypothetical protein [Candidatus Limnocylindrales bacterium]
MTQNDIHGIENGWSVKSVDGQGIGSVEETTDRYILVKSGLINASHRYLPAATLEHVRPELKEIGISLTAEAVEQGDWSEPPSEGPRSEGAPLNVESDADADEAMGIKTNVEPEKPAEEVTHRV